MPEEAPVVAPPKPAYDWRLIVEMVAIMDNEEADAHSKLINGAIKIMLVDRMQEIALKSCYICDGFGHSVEVCPTAPLVRNIATQAAFPKLKTCVTTSIASMKVKGFRKVMASQHDNA